MFKLNITWGVSNARDTAGYNICRLRDTRTNKLYKCLGGGYDMLGTVLGNWLIDNYRDRILALGDGNLDGKYNSSYGGFYGAIKMNGKLWLDGACGRSSMEDIARAIGLEVSAKWSERKKFIEYFIIKDTRG